ncbi:hypothetical protein BDB00DRAFT_817710 [Zychaea mexicana]|uniref:uncharacterized protein n=1 Tax=Zychaea mexicana TaxID=64656 RepID=UPI0022FE7CF7|nr:uncharacterized protein BDB00DRAFT_817710 [Zychaea mexicana]KAI9494657.1 hypothetical protein BDB00DRAFT_817710 [Zychaea mexicana]
MSETRAKNQQIRQEQRRVELMQRLSELGIWYDPESSMAFQRYIIRGKPNLETVIQGLVEEADMHREQEARQQELETRLKHALAELLVDQDDGYEDGGEEKSQQQRVTEYITTLRDCIVYIQFGLPEQLDQVVEAVVERARQDQERETRRKKLEAKLTALKLEEYITSYECITYIHSDQPEDVEHVIHAIAERERERQERVETIARRRKELTDRLEEENIYHVFGHIEHQIAMLWMEIESIISNAKREAADQKAKEDRRRVLEERLRENEVELREDSAICTSYINHGTGNLDDVVTRMTELAWYFRETNYGAIRHGVHGRLYYKRVSLEQYIRERLSSMKFGPVSHDPDTLARPPPSLWSTIKVLEFKEWKEHARACMVEGLVRTSNITVKEIIRQQLESTNVLNSAHLAGIVTNEVLVAAMDEGAVALAKIPSSSSSTSASSSSITTSTRSFSSALREMLGDVTFSIFVESYRLPAVSNVRKRLFDEQVSTSAAVSNPGASSNVQQHTNNTANDSNVASDNDNNEDVPMPDAPYTTE